MRLELNVLNQVVLLVYAKHINFLWENTINSTEKNRSWKSDSFSTSQELLLDF